MAGEYELLTGYINNLNKWINEINTNLSKYQKDYDKIQAKKVEYTNLASFFNSIVQSTLTVASNLEENANTLRNAAKGTTRLTADAQKLDSLVQELRNLSKSNYSNAYITNCVEASNNYLNSVINPLLENFTESFIVYNTTLVDLTNMKTNLLTISVSYDAVKNDPASLQEWQKLFKEFTETKESPYQQVALQYSNTVEKLNNYNSQIAKMSTPEFMNSGITYTNNYSKSISYGNATNTSNTVNNANSYTRTYNPSYNGTNTIRNQTIFNGVRNSGSTIYNPNNSGAVSNTGSGNINNIANSILNRIRNVVNTAVERANASASASQDSTMPLISMPSGAKYRGNVENISNNVQAMVSSGYASATSKYNAKTGITKTVARDSSGGILGKWFSLPDGRSYSTKEQALERYGTQDARIEISRYSFVPNNASRTGQIINYFEGSYDVVVTGDNYSKVESYDAGSQFTGKIVNNTNDYGDRLAITNSDNSKTVYKYNKNGVPVRVDVDENGNRKTTKNPSDFPSGLNSNS